MQTEEGAEVADRVSTCAWLEWDCSLASGCHTPLQLPSPKGQDGADPSFAFLYYLQ